MPTTLKVKRTRKPQAERTDQLNDPWIDTFVADGEPYFINLTRRADIEFDRSFANFVRDNCALTLIARHGDTDFIFRGLSSTGAVTYKVNIFRDFDREVYGTCTCYANREKHLLCKHVSASYLTAVDMLSQEGHSTRDFELFLTGVFAGFKPKPIQPAAAAD